ncbi:PAS domain-containing sensor histidine kinase [Dehalococcoides mccartyi]|uniref:histidine kinase n=1 Tax=Dehalococcoides mccartyi (strain CBDB1) TaxID=255470 RepID=A0A916KN54_DEHMC|nr:PAS domain-containing sensor histidine kinase [Dehalococcoides mccartyi]CAI83514.1 sensor histidine kinase [Dehalococcoides mccartyi CBDB1]
MKTPRLTSNQSAVKEEILRKENQKLKRDNQLLRHKCDSYCRKYAWYHALFNFSGDPFIIHTYYDPPDTEKPYWLEEYLKKEPIVEVNKAFTQTMGYTKKQATQLTVYDIENDKKWTMEQTHELFEKMQTCRKGRVTRFERPHFTSAGKTIPVEIKSRILKIDNNEYIMTVARDISDRKKLEAEMQRSYLSEKRHAANLQKEIHTRIEFTRCLVHELKTPLTPILASSEALVKMEPAKTIQGELARNIHRGACGLNVRINELLDLARLEISELVLRKSMVLPNRIIEEVVAEMKQQLIARGQNIDLHIPADLPVICADPERLKQILRNLLNNAVKYNKDNGRIFLEAKIADGFIKIDVKDQGKGITQKNQKHLFQPYFRCEEDRSKMDGLGLGLFLSKSLVELHKGTIELQSKRGKGTTVSFKLPLSGKEKVEAGDERA